MNAIKYPRSELILDTFWTSKILKIGIAQKHEIITQGRLEQFITLIFFCKGVCSGLHISSLINLFLLDKYVCQNNRMRS
jgi:hypothetical protein